MLTVNDEEYATEDRQSSNKCQEHYDDLRLRAFYEVGNDERKTPKPNGCMCVIRRPFIKPFVGQDNTVGFFIGTLFLMLIFSIGTPSTNFGAVAYWFLVVTSILLIGIWAISIFVYETLKSQRGLFLFQFLYRTGCISIACHPQIGHILDGAPYDDRILTCVRWLTLRTLPQLSACYLSDNYQAVHEIRNPTDWQTFVDVLKSMREEARQHPREIEMRKVEAIKAEVAAAKYGHNPILRWYVSDVEHDLRNIIANVDNEINGLSREQAIYSLPHGFKVCHPEANWRKRFCKGELPTKRFAFDYKVGEAWLLYFPFGTRGYRVHDRVVDRKTGLRLLGMKDSSDFASSLEGWNFNKQLAIRGDHGYVRLLDVWEVQLCRDLDRHVETIRRRESEHRAYYNSYFNVSDEDFRLPANDDDAWETFDVAVQRTIEEARAKIREYIDTSNSWSE